MTAFNLLSLGFENLVVYQIKLYHFIGDSLNCYQLSDGPESNVVEEWGGGSEYLQFLKYTWKLLLNVLTQKISVSPPL